MMEPENRIFPLQPFELLVRSYLDNLVEWDVVHNFAMAHFDDEYLPEYQRPIEDLHMMFFPPVKNDSQTFMERKQMRYLLDVLDLLRGDVEEYGVEAVRRREAERIANEDPSKHIGRAEYRERFRRRRRPPEQ